MSGPRKLVVVIENAGDTTCASVAGVFCSHLRTAHHGQAWICGLFDRAHPVTTGWLQRFPECIDAEKAGIP